MDLTITTSPGTHTLKISRINKYEKSLDYTLLPKIYNSNGASVDLLDILNSLSGNQYSWNPPSSGSGGR